MFALLRLIGRHFPPGGDNLPGRTLAIWVRLSFFFSLSLWLSFSFFYAFICWLWFSLLSFFPFPLCFLFFFPFLSIFWLISLACYFVIVKSLYIHLLLSSPLHYIFPFFVSFLFVMLFCLYCCFGFRICLPSFASLIFIDFETLISIFYLSTFSLFFFFFLFFHILPSILANKGWWGSWQFRSNLWLSFFYFFPLYYFHLRDIFLSMSICKGFIYL